MEEAVKLTAKLYQCRDSSKLLYGKDYKKNILEWQHYIKACKTKHKLDTDLLAAMKLIEDCVGMDGAGTATMNILAAYVELIEPSV